MKNPIIIAVLAAINLSGCIAIPRFEMAETLRFDYVMEAPRPMSTADLLCCYDCHA